MNLKSPQKGALKLRLQRLLLASFLITSNLIFSQAFNNYYSATNGLSGSQLKTELNRIIKGQTEYPYTASTTDVWDMLKETDRDPNNAANVILIYSGRSVNAAQEYNSAQGWTREHVWAKSRGDFGTANGPGTDAHHLRPEDSGVNSIRNNRSFDNCVTCINVIDNGVDTGSKYDANLWTFEPRDAVKGDVARMLFYMAVRYEGENGEPNLELNENLPNNTDKTPFHGKLSTLITWSRADPVDDWERNRNEIIFNNFQHNRNPFIDYPELMEYLWGNKTTQIWTETNTLSTLKNNMAFFTIYPNPVEKGLFNIQSQSTAVKNINIYDMIGRQVFQSTTTATQIDVKHLITGVYFVKVLQDGKTATQKLVVK